MPQSPRTRLLALSISMLLLAGCGKAMDAIAVKACMEQDMSPKDDIEMCTRAIAASAGSEDLAFMHLVRGTAHQALEDMDAAISDFDRAIELDPELPDAWMERGYARLQQEEYAKAEADFAQGVELDPENGYVVYGHALALEMQERYEPARESIERAIALLEGDVEAHAEARGERCWIRAVLGIELEQAIADCDTALRVDGTAYNVMDSRGLANFRLGRHRDAIADYDRALAGDPDNADGYYVRGLARQALGETAQADTDIAKGLQMDAEVATRYAGYGVAASGVATTASATPGGAVQ